MGNNILRKIISFKKELNFRTKVCEITSISLEHVINKQDDDLVSGDFFISGEYKMTEGSINKEKYDFKLPFDIALNSNYEAESVKLEIDNFYYEILNNDILKVNVDLLIEANEKIVEEERLIEDYTDSKEIVEELLPDILEKEEIKEEIKEEKEEIKNEIDINNTNENEIQEENINNIFGNLNDETYRAYYVYVVKEEDTIEKILEKYSISKEELSFYNEIENIKAFDKIIIPTNGK